MAYRATLFNAVAALALLSGLALDARAQGNPVPLVTGTVARSDSEGYDESTTFTCRGVPLCSGSYTSRVRPKNCPNYYTFGGDFVGTGFELAQAGAIQGSLTISPGFIEPARDGTCGMGSENSESTLAYTATWNPASRTGLGSAQGPKDVFSFRFSADVNAPAAVFPLGVRSRIDLLTATVTANLQFRAEDVGGSGSIYVFASAPANAVQGGLAAKAVHLGFARGAAKADPPTPCVLAQLSPSGQLVAISASQLQAYLSGTLSALGASVSILNGVPTPSVAGATFYVGYGPSGAAMLDNGIFRNAAMVAGSGVCPMLPSQTALWWNPSESGWGLNLNHQGGVMFGTLFTYDAGRAPLWLVMPNGAMQADGVSFTGDLYRTTGPAFNANPFTPIGPANITLVGTMTVSFAEANAGTLRYTVGGVEVFKPIQRQVYGSRAANCLPTTEGRASSSHYQDLWWNPAESGWGLNVTHQDNTLFATLFTYDAAGRDLWLVLPAAPRQADGSYFGDLYRTTGSPFNTLPFPPIGAADITAVGNMRLRFTDGNNGTLAYTYNGVPVTKAITRQVFSTPLFTCN